MSRYGSRIAAIARCAERDRASVASAPDRFGPDDANEFLRDGAGRAIGVYVDGRTGGRMVRFSEAEMAALQRALNDWLECYARCHGVDLDADVTVREAAELLLETRNVHDVGQLLTGVPERTGSGEIDANGAG